MDTCAGGEILLTNQDFVDPKKTIDCNNGAIAVRGIDSSSTCYISRLNITFNITLQGRTVRCSVDNGTHASIVGVDSLSVSTGKVYVLYMPRIDSPSSPLCHL